MQAYFSPEKKNASYFTGKVWCVAELRQISAGPVRAGSFFDKLEVADSELEVVAVLVLGLVDVESDTAHFWGVPGFGQGNDHFVDGIILQLRGDHKGTGGHLFGVGNIPEEMELLDKWIDVVEFQ